jgi:hypothetical protein
VRAPASARSTRRRRRRRDRAGCRAARSAAPPSLRQRRDASGAGLRELICMASPSHFQATEAILRTGRRGWSMKRPPRAALAAHVGQRQGREGASSLIRSPVVWRMLRCGDDGGHESRR